MKESNIDSILGKSSFLKTGNTSLEGENLERNNAFIQNLITPGDTNENTHDQN
jgi:hypothetical protein